MCVRGWVRVVTSPLHSGLYLVSGLLCECVARQMWPPGLSLSWNKGKPIAGPGRRCRYRDALVTSPGTWVRGSVTSAGRQTFRDIKETRKGKTSKERGRERERERNRTRSLALFCCRSRIQLSVWWMWLFSRFREGNCFAFLYLNTTMKTCTQISCVYCTSPASAQLLISGLIAVIAGDCGWGWLIVERGGGLLSGEAQVISHGEAGMEGKEFEWNGSGRTPLTLRHLTQLSSRSETYSICYKLMLSVRVVASMLKNVTG